MKSHIVFRWPWLDKPLTCWVQGIANFHQILSFWEAIPDALNTLRALGSSKLAGQSCDVSRKSQREISIDGRHRNSSTKRKLMDSVSGPQQQHNSFNLWPVTQWANDITLCEGGCRLYYGIWWYLYSVHTEVTVDLRNLAALTHMKEGENQQHAGIHLTIGGFKLLEMATSFVRQISTSSTTSHVATSILIFAVPRPLHSVLLLREERWPEWQCWDSTWKQVINLINTSPETVVLSWIS